MKILRCPFCRSKNEPELTRLGLKPLEYVVYCLNCNANSPNKQTGNQAIAAWNTVSIGMMQWTRAIIFLFVSVFVVFLVAMIGIIFMGVI